MLRALILLHRWLGISFCLLFAMWFGTGMVMHFVPFPALTEAERIDGLAPIDPSKALRGPVAAVDASGIGDARRVRLLQRSDGPVYIVTGASGVRAVRADDRAGVAVKSGSLALTIAEAAAHRRGLDASKAAVVAVADYDQWTVPNGFDRHRPLYRIALNDIKGTEFYVSSVTGEVVLDTTRHERAWNYVGSVTHWIYPTILRSKWAAWDKTVWTLSLAALIAAISGSVLGILRMNAAGIRTVSPYAGWHGWHHVLGLACMTFVLTWIFSGWLSMDHGRLFSRGQLTEAEALTVAGAPAWDALPADQARHIGPQTLEVEWLVFDRKFFRRERTGLNTQLLLSLDSGVDDASSARREFLRPREIGTFVERLAQGCEAPVIVDADDNYAIVAPMPDAPVYRSICGNAWFHIDGASGEVLERLDPSRRAYRWLYSALHRMDFPILAARPALRSVIIVTLCSCGLVFSLTGVVIGWRRLRLHFRRYRSPKTTP
jgi:uncharacterized iron-regulated membrane protein